MSLAYLVVSLSPLWCGGFGFGGGVLEQKRRVSAPANAGGVFKVGRVTGGGVLCFGSRRGVRVWGRLKAATEAPAVAVESGARVESVVEIPVTCYQVLGVPEKAEKDEVVKAAMDLKSSEVEDGYTADIIVSRQDLLVDVRDKLLFEPEYVGNIKEKVPPKSSLRIPWSWLPAALCLLQELAGGTASMQQLKERLEKDLIEESPQAARLKVLASGNATERRYSVWIGGSILASLGSFQQMWFSKAEQV